MIVSHRHQFVFVRSTKTAATSIEIALSEHCGPDDIITKISAEDEVTRQELGFRGPQHSTIPFHRYTPRMAAGSILKRRRPNFFNHMPAEAIQRALGPTVWNSYFKFSIERNPYDKAISRYWWTTRDQEPRPPLVEFLRGGPKLSNWPIYTIDDEVAVDRMLRFEHLQDELIDIGELIGIDIHLPERRAKGSYRKDRRPYTDVIDPASRALIEDACAHELKTFGYTWD